MKFSENKAHSANYRSKNELFMRRCRHYKAKESKAEFVSVRYRYRDSLINILCMGVDQKSISQEKVYGNGGQADAVLLVSLDTDTGQVTVLNLSRDTITDR